MKKNASKFNIQNCLVVPRLADLFPIWLFVVHYTYFVQKIKHYSGQMG